MRSVLIRAKGAAIFRAIFVLLLEGKPSPYSAVTFRPKALCRARRAVATSATLQAHCCAGAISHLLSSSVALLQRLSSSFSSLGCLLPPLCAPMCVVERIVELSCYPQMVQEHRESFLATATTARFLAFSFLLRGRLSSLHDVLDLSQS